MIRKIALSLVLLLAGKTFAQQPVIDSLNHLLAGHSARDTIRLHLLNELSFAYYTVDPAKGVAIATEAIALARELDHPRLLAAAYNNKGTNHWAKGEDSLAMEAGEQALRIHNQSGNRLGAAKALNNLALNYYNLSNFPKALEYHETALHLFTALHHSAGIAHSHTNMGVVYLSLSDYPKALRHFLDGARYWQEDSVAFANTLLNIGLVYKNMREYTKAQQYAQQALDIYVRAGQKQGEANACGNLGTLYSATGDPEAALRYYKRALTLNETIGNKRRIASDLVNMAVVYQETKDLPTARQYLRKGLQLYEQTNDKENTSFTMIKLAEAGDQPEVYLEKALQLATEAGSLQYQSLAWEVKSRAFAKAGKNALALEAYKQHIQLRDSIYNSAKTKEITRQQIQFEYEKKEALLKAAHDKDIALAQARDRQRKTMEVAVLAGILLLSAASATGYLLYKKRKDAELHTRMADTEMKALRAQMNPHFIFNSLNAISSFISNNKPALADDFLVRFSRLIRMILENSEYKEITLSEDLEVLELYMQLERMRLRERFDYVIEVDETVDASNTLIPPLLLQPFVENSIWHGFSGNREGGRIQIRISRQEKELVCIVEDNGHGRTKTHSDHRSLGTQITRARISMLQHADRSGSEVVFTDLPEGLSVTIRLPVHHKF
ncbi:tetratricopeptide repeat-containing sensor histidine kinase [Chitinophaga cymbidii]|uniref:Signal transduction histidine kinase internal region domain-containing protein n=1 Tax=Chitinophaga cymbidii TaxID=1096750 RepID=A0A512RR70_9BACT|nr:tetratricopeptide repeat protein [Chitinophaga cymbidii]GEP98180.1 hypothetical protein CCY01nite_44400 [Chitinophaga cymbidii]